MRIESYFGTTPERITNKEHNIYLGMSMGNRYFTKENIETYLKWAVENTKDNVVVLIADRIHAFNYEVFNGYTPKQALDAAINHGNIVENTVRKVINRLKNGKTIPKNSEMIKIAKYDEIVHPYYKEKLEIVLNEYKTNIDFKMTIQEIVLQNLQKRKDIDKISSDKSLDKLAQYILYETPLLINGIEYKNKRYDLYPYPAKNVSEFIFKLQQGTIFKKLSEKLEITHPAASIEAYVE
jgi:tRNA-dependent cyclodipeptide synthase